MSKKRCVVVYYWYDHLLLRKNGDADIVQKAIREHDFETYMSMRKKYPPYIDDDGYTTAYFPDTAILLDRETGDFIEFVDVTVPEGFDRIESSGFECG